MKLKEIINEIINEIMADKDIKYRSVFGKIVRLDIFENPTPEEMKEAGRTGIRGVKKKNGKIYVPSEQDSNGIIHEDIVNILSQEGYITDKYNDDWWKNVDSIGEYLCIIWKRNKWFVSESYVPKMNRKEFSELVKENYRNVVVKDEQ